MGDADGDGDVGMDGVGDSSSDSNQGHLRRTKKCPQFIVAEPRSIRKSDKYDAARYVADASRSLLKTEAMESERQRRWRRFERKCLASTRILGTREGYCTPMVHVYACPHCCRPTFDNQRIAFSVNFLLVPLTGETFGWRGSITMALSVVQMNPLPREVRSEGV